jgi:hypothetical protein
MQAAILTNLTIKLNPWHKSIKGFTYFRIPAVCVDAKKDCDCYIVQVTEYG